jgi:predicted phosphodiesterase
MRLAVVSDIHGNLHALSAVIADIRVRGCDAVVNLGDILSGPLWPEQTADMLIPLQWPTIRGNHERQVLETPRETMGASDAYARDNLRQDQLEWLAALPATLWLTDEVFLCHGTPANDMAYFVETPVPGLARAATVEEVATRAGDCPARVILCGHTHVPRTVELPDGRLVVNPGSVGLQAFHVGGPVAHAVENGSPHARYAIIERRSGRWHAQAVNVEYDHPVAARMAMHNGRPDWAYALETGRVAQENP